MKARKTPMRMCVGCREMKEKRELIRVVHTPEGEIMPDFKGKANGRGAYLCDSADCLRSAQKSKALERAFECAVPEGVFEELHRQMSQESRED